MENKTPKNQLPKVFFIGFNKTGTTSFHMLFRRSGYSSYHNLAMKKKKNLGVSMHNNLHNGLPILQGINRANAYSDLGGRTEDSLIEGCTFFKELFSEYPDAYFILQTRNQEKWIDSRKNHGKNKGKRSLLERQASFLNCTQNEIVQSWNTIWLEHHNNVRSFFTDNCKFLEFNIENDDIDKLINHLQSHYNLSKKFWKKHNRTI